MAEKVVYTNQFIKITRDSDNLYIESFKSGMKLHEFNKVLTDHPEIKIIDFGVIKDSISNAPLERKKFGVIRERISVQISDNELRAYVTLSVPESEFKDKESKEKLAKEIEEKLEEHGVVFGIKHNEIAHRLCNNNQILVAEGMIPKNGEDSVVKKYELNNKPPKIKENQVTQTYEFTLINKVKKDQWVGEVTDPTPGVDGKSVKGNVIKAQPGEKLEILYDNTLISETHENGITTLRTIVDGVVTYKNNKLCILEHYIITKNLDNETGSINCDSYLTIHGTVENGFSAIAKNDIEILGDFGVGSAKEICSKEGSVYIKGGIAGKGNAVIKAKKDVYVKFVSNTKIECEGTVHIGIYSLDSIIEAKEVIVDSFKGKIIGGTIIAQRKITTPILGSDSEVKTIVTITGIDRENLRKRLEDLSNYSNNLKAIISKLKMALDQFNKLKKLTAEQKVNYDGLKEKYEKVNEQMLLCENEKKDIIENLKIRGNGQITVIQRVYPGAILKIKNEIKEIAEIRYNKTYFYEKNQIYEV